MVDHSFLPFLGLRVRARQYQTENEQLVEKLKESEPNLSKAEKLKKVRSIAFDLSVRHPPIDFLAPKGRIRFAQMSIGTITN